MRHGPVSVVARLNADLQSPYRFLLTFSISMIITSFVCISCWLIGTRGEGAVFAMEGGEVGDSVLEFQGLPTKQHGCEPSLDFGRVGGNATTLQIRKRSLKRAYRRLHLHGYTWYRGQLWQQQVTLPAHPTSSVEFKKQIPCLKNTYHPTDW